MPDVSLGKFDWLGHLEFSNETVPYVRIGVRQFVDVHVRACTRMHVSCVKFEHEAPSLV